MPGTLDAAKLAELIASELPTGEDGTTPLFAGLRGWRHRLGSILQIVTDGVVVRDFTGGVVYLNEPARRIFGVDEPDAILGHGMDALYALRGATRVTRQRDEDEELVRLRGPDGEERWLLVRVAPIWDEQRRAVALISVLSDVTESQRASQRLTLLADAGGVLGTSLDAETTLRAVAHLLVPRFADVAVVFTGEPDGLHVACAPPREHDEVRARALTLWSRASVALLEGAPRPLDERDAVFVPFASELGLRAGMIAPLDARGRALGALLLCTERARFDALDLETAADLGRRCASALDVAHAYRRSERANQRLAEADQKKDEFLAMLAHELRNPLTPLLTAAELLRMRGREADLGALSSVIEGQVRHLTRLVDDLLDVSRIAHGKIELRAGRVDLHEVIARAVELSEPAMKARGHTLSVDLPPAPLALDADDVRLTQVFANLLHNGAKYTETGGRIAIRASREAERAVVVVEDDGIGIERALLPRVFDLFVQGQGGHGRGLGVGLYMVRELVTMHGGTIEATSEGHGRGSRFRVELPLAMGDAPSEGPAPVGPPRWTDVLIVDDEPEIASVLAALLEALGCAPRIAHDAEQALASARQRAPELVLLDLGMPGVSGYAVARELRRMGLRSTRIVALSGYAQPADRERTREAGFDLHLSKPVRMQTLAALLADEPIEP